MHWEKVCFFQNFDMKVGFRALITSNWHYWLISIKSFTCGFVKSLDFLFFIFIVYAITVVPTFSFFPISTQPPFLPSLRPSPHCCQCPWVMHICSWLIPHLLSSTLPSSSFLTAVSLFHVPCLCFYFVCLFCSLDSTYK